MPVNAPHYLTSGRLAVEVHADRPALGRAAARAVAAHLHGVIARQGEARVIFACAPSQDQFLAALIDPAQCGLALDWSRITAFHMDDYVGLTAAHPQSTPPSSKKNPSISSAWALAKMATSLSTIHPWPTSKTPTS